MSVLDRLSTAPGVYWGEGQGPGGQRFVARVAVQKQHDDSVTLDYEAWSPQGGLQHAETARVARTDDSVTLAATSNGGDDVMLFREGDSGVFGSVGAQRVGLVITDDEQRLTFAWWWTGRDGQLREQSRAVVTPMRQIVVPPAVPGAQRAEPVGDDAAESVEGEAAVAEQTDAVPDVAEAAAEAVDESGDESADESGDESADALVDEPDDERVSGDEATSEPATAREDEHPAAQALRDLATLEAAPQPGQQPGTPKPAPQVPHEGRRRTDQPATPAASAGSADAEGPTSSSVVPWPGILVLHGPGTGLVAQRLAARLTRAAVVRTDLFDRAVRGTAGRPDPALRQRIAVSVVQGYAATGHPVILHGGSTRAEHEQLVAAISGSGLSPVQLVEVSEGEDYGEVARRLIDSD